MTTAMLPPPRRYAFALPFVILISSFVIPAPAHPADISHLKVRVEPRRLEFRLTFNLYTLQQFHRVDVDGDGRITKTELAAAEEPLRDYLAKHVLITINGQDSDLGEARRMERMWPTESAGADVAAPDFAQRFVDFTFVKTSEPLLQDVWIGFDIFKETGELHVVQAVFEQDGKPAEVSFSQSEPEFLWDTGFAEAPAATAESAATTETSGSKKNPASRTIVIVIALAAILATWLLLGKVRRISRGGFRIGPRE